MIYDDDAYGSWQQIIITLLFDSIPLHCIVYYG